MPPADVHPAIGGEHIKGQAFEGTSSEKPGILRDHAADSDDCGDRVSVALERPVGGDAPRARNAERHLPSAAR